MNITYEKPIIFENDEISEGVYLASGGTSSGCYTASGIIHQTPHGARGFYSIQINGTHNANHTNESQTITVSFNQEVTNATCNSVSSLSGVGTSTIVLYRNGHQNGNDHIGFGDLKVESAAGLQILSVTISD
jgi:hypothetical protein